MIALAEALDIRDTGTGQHSHTVARYAELMARELGLDEERIERVRLAGVLHDIGKIGISDRVLTKPGPLDKSEWQEMHTHPEIGARLLSRPSSRTCASGSSPTTSAPTASATRAACARPDPARGAHPRGRRRLRGDDRATAATAPPWARRPPAPSSRAAPARSSTRPSWPRSCARSTRAARSACAAWPSASEDRRDAGHPPPPQSAPQRRASCGCVDSRNSGFSIADW